MAEQAPLFSRASINYLSLRPTKAKTSHFFNVTLHYKQDTKETITWAQSTSVKMNKAPCTAGSGQKQYNSGDQAKDSF